MGAVKDMYMDEAENIINVTATKLMGGDISEDDALDILDNNLDILGMLGFENKYDALAVVYQMTNQIYKENI
tara:strand:- start:263 stop:478 length:216 start_codon:yes stop_codon:yes gene_type:complete